MKRKALIVITTLCFVVGGILLTAGIVGIKVERLQAQKEEQEETKEQSEPLVITIPTQNNMGTITIIGHDETTGEEVVTEVYGQIKILNNGRNGEQQRYILYTE